jgi:hypothetical protein
LIVLLDSDSSSDGEEKNPVASVIRQVLGTQPLDEEEILFHLPVGGHIPTPRSLSKEEGFEVNSLGFQGKEKSKELGKSERKQMIWKDNVTTSMLDKSKTKEILQYVCCDRICFISNFGLE